jgi:hypothetical protein
MEISTAGGPVLLIHAVSLDFPEMPGGHVNKMPFSGILTRIDEPSDSPPGGAGGKRVLITRAAAEGALASLLGMGVDLTKDLAGHDAQKKIGIITGAHIDGSALRIAGFIYAADFPDEALRIHTDHADLGFSFEARNLGVESATSDPLIVKSCTFTGAAILLKNEAAYKTTALAAAKAKEKHMEAEVLKAIGAAIEAALAPVTKTLVEVTAAQTEQATKADALAATLEEMKKAPPIVHAVAATVAKVEPHANRVEAAAEQMEKDGIGLHETSGHVSHMRRMAGAMRADAAVGKMPHAYHDAGSYWAQAEAARARQEQGKDPPVVKIEETVEFKAMKAAHDKEVADAKDATAALETKVKDLEGKFSGLRPSPDRKTMDPGINALLARAGITAPEEGQMLSLSKVDAAINAMPGGMDVGQRMHLKTALARAGVLSPNGT